MNASISARNILPFFLFLLFAVSPSAGALQTSPGFLDRFPENHEIRNLLSDLIIAPTSEVLATSENRYQQNISRSRVAVRVETQGDSFYILFINEKEYRFPVYSRGTYIIKRSLDTGEFVQLKIFIKDDPQCFLRISPLGERTVLEMELYGKTIYRNINLPYSITDAALLPFSDLVGATGSILDWGLVFPDLDSRIDDDVEYMVNSIRSGLPDLSDTDDGAMDSDGSYVLIETLGPQNGTGFNCSGFVKWIGDGIFSAITGRLMSVEALKEKHLESRGHSWSARHEDDRDPYFGLDWTRNIAVSIMRAAGYKNAGYEDADVTGVPWSRYVDDVGFPVEDLKSILYWLAVTDPGYMYLGSVNIPYGEKPVLRQHVHVAAFFPSLDSSLEFRPSVMERNMETDFESLSERYPGAYVHLVRIRVPDMIVMPDVQSVEGIGDRNLLRRF